MFMNISSIIGIISNILRVRMFLPCIRQTINMLDVKNSIGILGYYDICYFTIFGRKVNENEKNILEH